MSEVLFAAYGDMKNTLPVLLGRELGVGRFATLQGVELCIQSFDQVPDVVVPNAPAPISPKTVLSEHWDGNFRTYALQKVDQKQTPALIYGLSAEERQMVLEEWNLGDFGWFQDLTVRAVTSDGSELEVVTDVISTEQSATAFSHDGSPFLPSLNGSKSIEVAALVRSAYLDRIST